MGTFAMDREEYEARYRDMLALAHGRWTEILRELGVDGKLLSRRNQPCPINDCGGTDRFQYTDKFGEGNYICRHCGAGGGFKLLRAVTGWNAGNALLNVEQCLGALGPRQSQSQETQLDRMRALALRIWDEAVSITPSDDANRYLAGRKLDLTMYPESLRFHRALGYFEPSGDGRSRRVRDYPALLARIDDQDGALVSLHRTYLKDGAKAPVADPKKTLSGGINGAAIRLAQATQTLNVCEGLENALAIFKRSGKEPVWSGISAGNLQRLWIPQCVRELRIYADNDADSDFAGQLAAFTLARASRQRHIDVKVFVPHKAGSDWADVWLARSDHLIRVA
jgi:putative DNA primase/helicase